MLPCPSGFTATECSLLALGCFTWAWGKQTRLCMIPIIDREWCLAEKKIITHWQTGLSLKTQTAVWAFDKFPYAQQNIGIRTPLLTRRALLSWTTQQQLINGFFVLLHEASVPPVFSSFPPTPPSFLQPFFPCLSHSSRSHSNPLSRCQVSTAGSH